MAVHGGVFGMPFTEVDRPSYNIILMEWHTGAGLGGHASSHRWAGHYAARNNPVRDAEFWGHGFGELNWLMADGHTAFLPYEDTFQNVRNAWTGHKDVRRTLWDCLGSP